MNKYFDANLYKEAIRQTKVIAIILAIIYVVITLIGEGSDLIDVYSSLARGHEPWLRTLTFMESTPMLWLSMFLTPLLLVMKLFSFMNKRRASDFYHAIPQTRKTLFGSFFAGILTWILGIALMVTLVSLIFYMISPAIIFTPSLILLSFLGFLVGAFLVTSGLLLAKGLSGTGLTNIVIAAMILFYPRIIILIINSIFMNITGIIYRGDTNLFTNVSYNIPFSLFNPDSVLWAYGLADVSRSVVLPSIFYTFILGLIYFILAGVLFCKRKSETAGKGAISPSMQHVLRCLLIFPLTLGIPSMLFSPFRHSGTFGVDVVGIVFLVIFILIVYFVYELIITRKLIRLVKAIPSLCIVILVNILLCLLLFFGRGVVWNNVPVAENIVGVRVIEWRSPWQTFSYNQILAREIYIYNPEMNQYIEETFRRNVDEIRYGPSDEEEMMLFVSRENPDLSTLDLSEAHDSTDLLTAWCISCLEGGRQGMRLNLSIQMDNGRTMMRSLNFHSETGQWMRESRILDSTYREKATKLPEIEEDTEISIRFTNHTVNMPEDAFTTQEERERFWDIFATEYYRLNVDEKVYHNGMGTRPREDIITVGEIVVSGTVGLEAFRSTYKITNLTPMALEILLNMIYESNETVIKEHIDYILESSSAEELVNFQVDLSEVLTEYDVLGRGQQTWVFQFTVTVVIEEIFGDVTLEELREILGIIREDSLTGGVSADEDIYLLSINIFTNYFWEDNYIFINISPENRRLIDEILNAEKEH